MKHRFYVFAAFGASLLILGSFLLAFAARSLPRQQTPPKTEREAVISEPTSTDRVETHVIIRDNNEVSATPNADTCAIGGCSGEICGEANEIDGMASICVYRPEYACYKNSRCERQQNGTCGWTQTPELTQCAANPPSEENTF